MIGEPLPIAILNRSWIVTLGVGSEQRRVSGRSDVAMIAFASSGIGFRAIEAGKFLVLFTTETLRQELAVSVSSPASAVMARNDNEWKKISFDQVMSVAFAPNGALNYWNVSAYTVQSRIFMPFEHVSHCWLCDLDEDESSTLDLTISDPTELKWMLAVIRISPFTTGNRNANIYPNFGPATTNGSVTISSVLSSQNYGRRAISSTANGRFVRFNFAPPTTGVDYTAIVRIFPTSGGTGGSITVAIEKQPISGSPTVIGSTTMTIPSEGFQVWEMFMSSSTFTGEFLNLFISNIDNGEKFEVEFEVNAA